MTTPQQMIDARRVLRSKNPIVEGLDLTDLIWLVGPGPNLTNDILQDIYPSVGAVRILEPGTLTHDIVLDFMLVTNGTHPRVTIARFDVGNFYVTLKQGATTLWVLPRKQKWWADVYWTGAAWRVIRQGQYA